MADEGDADSSVSSVVIDSSDMSSVNDEAAIEAIAEEYASKNYRETKKKIDYDRYHFSVGQKYDLTNRRLTFKKYKYISDELFLDLRFRLWKTITWQTSMLILLFLYFLRMFVHFTVQYIYLKIDGVPVTRFQPHWHKIDLIYAGIYFY